MSVMEMRFALEVITIALVSETFMCRLPPPPPPPTPGIILYIKISLKKTSNIVPNLA